MINWKWCTVEGILLFILGIFAISRPGVAAEAFVTLFGWLLIFFGAISLFGGVTSQTGARKPVSLGVGFVAIIFGFIFIFLPATTLVMMTILLAAFFFLSGFAEIASSFSLRSLGGHNNHWGLAFFNGVIGIVLGVLLLSTWPESFEVIGLLLGLNFLLSGAYLVSLGWFFHNAPSH
ncbi:MAG: DUF308 domain-containing protein [Phycisphaerales bacterium]|nr:DUF308 domain-containing protein [Planctomycetota bacterium]MBL6997704.1 DUF308 domain-containing protein [Phycisphaerales bacterium]